MLQLRFRLGCLLSPVPDGSRCDNYRYIRKLIGPAPIDEGDDEYTCTRMLSCMYSTLPSRFMTVVVLVSHMSFASEAAADSVLAANPNAVMDSNCHPIC